MKKIIRHLRNYKRFSINLVLIILFFVFISCKHSGTRLFSLYDLRSDIKDIKEPLISENFYSSDILYTLNEEDLFFYNDDTQVLSFPYAGYVIKSRDDSLILLSNLWDINLID